MKPCRRTSGEPAPARCWGAKRVLTGWYPATKLEMDEELRTLKRTKFGGEKFVYPRPVMRELREFFEEQVPARLPGARVLYFT